MLARIRQRQEEEGFTLIELLVVMIIIGILAAIAIPIFLNQRKSAHDAAIKSDLRSAATEVESFYVNSQKYPTAAEFATLETSTIKKSPNVSLAYTAPASATDGFCIAGTSTETEHTFAYDSDTGGLKSGTSATC